MTSFRLCTVYYIISFYYNNNILIYYFYSFSMFLLQRITFLSSAEKAKIRRLILLKLWRVWTDRVSMQRVRNQNAHSVITRWCDVVIKIVDVFWGVCEKVWGRRGEELNGRKLYLIIWLKKLVRESVFTIHCTSLIFYKW